MIPTDRAITPLSHQLSVAGVLRGTIFESTSAWTESSIALVDSHVRIMTPDSGGFNDPKPDFVHI